MYTIESLRNAVGRVHGLLGLMRTLKPGQYKHDRWANHCGTPCCTLGWATTVWNDIELVGAAFSVYYPRVVGRATYESQRDFERDMQATIGIDSTIYSYLFEHYILDGKRSRLMLHHDGKLSTAIRRLTLIESYLRRRLATLEAEQESREVLKQMRREASRPRKEREVCCG